MQSQPFFNTLAGISVSLAGFASLIAWLREDLRSWDPTNLWRVKTIVREALTLAGLALALNPIFNLTSSESSTIRIGTGVIVVLIISDFIRHWTPDPTIWYPAITWKIFMSGNALYLALLAPNLFWANLGLLQVGFLLMLASPAGIFYNFVRELGRNRSRRSSPSRGAHPMRRTTLRSRPMRFGAFVPQGWRHDLAGIPVEDHWATMTNVATTIERVGFESLWVYDHFHTVPAPTQNVTYEAWTLMAALAVATDTVRLGQMCTCNTYRPPSYLAKVAASVDVISGGRLEMGIGAGWYEDEHDGYGYPFLRPAERIGMLREGVEIMKAMWTEDLVDYEGDYYELRGAICRPKPLQSPHVPLWIAGGGEQLTLNIAARHAAYSNFGVTLEEFVHKSEVLRGHCAEVGSDYDGIVRSSNFNVFCAETESEAADKIAWYRSLLEEHVPKDKADRQARLYEEFSGTPEQLISLFEKWQEAGNSYAIINFADAAYDTSGLELFAEKVIPALSG